MYKIIVADDNLLTIQALQATVPWEEWGFQLVGCAENGIDALSQLSLYHPDIAILDINMPGMTGLEVAKQLSLIHISRRTIRFPSSICPYAGTAMWRSKRPPEPKVWESMRSIWKRMQES